MRIRATVLLILVVALVAAAVSFTRSSRSLEKAAQLQKQGKPDQALAIYQDQLARTKHASAKSRSQLQLKVADCLSQLGRIPEAYSSYLRALETDPQNTEAHYRLGEIYLLAGEFERASDEANFLIRNGGNSADAFALIGAAAEATGKEDVARDAFENVLRQDPGRVKIALDLAELYNRAGNSTRSREILRGIANAKPNSSLPWLTLGRLEEQEGNIKAAEDAYRRAVSIENTPETNLRLAQYYERSARVLDAKSVLNRVDSMRPEQPTAAADFLLASGDSGQANNKYLSALQGAPKASKKTELTRRELIARLIESDIAKSDNVSPEEHSAAIAAARQHLAVYGPELPEAERSLLEAELALGSDDLVQAAISATKALQAAPQSATAHYISAIVRYRSSDSAGARSEWQQAVDIDPTFIPARIALADDSLREQDFSGAEEMILPVVRQEPSNIDALVIFARALIASKSYDSAQNIAMRIQALAPRSPYSHILRGEAALNLRNYASALIEFQQAVLLDTHSQEAIDGLSRVYALAKMNPAMLLKMEQMGLASPSSATLLEIVGRNFINIHRYADAERCLKESLAIDPSRHTAAEWLARIQAERGDLTSASKSVAKVQEFSPMLAGVQAEQQNDLNSAIAHYDRAVRSGDPTGVAANNLAWILAQQNRELDRALGLANKARELQPDNPAVLDTVGLVHLARREYTEAIGVLEHAQKIASLNGYSDATVLAEVNHHLAAAYLRTGQSKRAALVSGDASSPQ